MDKDDGRKKLIIMLELGVGWGGKTPLQSYSQNTDVRNTHVI